MITANVFFPSINLEMATGLWSMMANDTKSKTLSHQELEGFIMKLSCPNCETRVKLTLDEIQKPKWATVCPACKKSITLKNNLPVVEGNK
jgi:hypothetical protein